MEVVQLLLAILGGLITLVVVVASVTAYYKVSASQAQIKELRGDRDDQAQRIDRLKDELADERVEREKVTAENVSLKEKVAVLEKVVTGRDQLDSMQKQLTAHDKRVCDLLTTISGQLATCRMLDTGTPGV